ncbi:MAG: molecular chaperone HscC [Lachnospiraceae bacterium]|nr:molecular chaperone HscC [Lachnospiraceae bacterium]MBR6157242.1 molecular chaperone HscC [Lachnospiraceae bacterium]MBR6848878.1 molecular chaperone HscC [Lachnospiraceae bacterium]
MIIGIDLGTTNSLVACYKEDGPQIIPNRLGGHLTPSVVSVDGDQIYVGDVAKERMQLYPQESAAVFKRTMGTDKKYRLGSKFFRSEELSSFVLRSLKEDAEAYLGEEVTEAVISVPAYFNDARRKATKRAGELAGLKVERIISEPTAAAIAYGLYEMHDDAKILVFDLGGGTFDVSILELSGTILEVRAVAGDNYLGGEDFTEILVDMWFAENEKEYKLDRDNMDEKTLRHIHKQAELCKLGFCERNTSEMRCLIGEEEITSSFSLSAYESKCEDLLERIRIPVRKSLSDAKLRLSEIDKVVLVGGATRLPIVRHLVAKLFRSLPDTSVNPDEAIACGAAIQAAMKERVDTIREVILTDVCPFTLSTEVSIERDNGTFENGHVCPIIERNTVIPASRTETLYPLRDNQKSIRVNVLQGESRFAENNLQLGTMEIKLPEGKKDDNSVNVTYTYDINSILEVQVKVNSTGEIVKQILKGQDVDMTDEEIAARMEELAYLKIPPREQEKNKLLLVRSERLYEENFGDDRMVIEQHIRKFEQALNTQDPIRIDAARIDFKEFLDEWEKQKN